MTGSPKTRLTVALALIALAASVLASEAAARGVVAKDGRIYACYRAKGKHKGAVRLVPKRAKCRRGEHKVSWSVSGTPGPGGSSGQNGANGESGTAGAPGARGTTASIATLESQLSSLLSKVQALESILQGITHASLTEALAKLEGVSGLQLQEAVGALPTIASLCSQSSALTGQSNALGTALGEIGLGGIVPSGLLLELPAVAPLPSYSCP